LLRSAFPRSHNLCENTSALGAPFLSALQYILDTSQPVFFPILYMFFCQMGSLNSFRSVRFFILFCIQTFSYYLLHPKHQRNIWCNLPCLKIMTNPTSIIHELHATFFFGQDKVRTFMCFQYYHFHTDIPRHDGFIKYVFLYA